MPSLQSDEFSPWVKQMHDAIAENEAVRDGLYDNDAMVLIDWGADQAVRIGARLAGPGDPEPDSELVADTAYTLVRLMTRINWVVTYRRKKDAAWLTRTFTLMNQLSRQINGPDAPTLSDDEIAAWIAGHESASDSDLLADLIARLTPPSADAPAAPETLSEDESPAPPDSTTTRPPTLPGRPSWTEYDPDTSLQGDDEHE